MNKLKLLATIVSISTVALSGLLGTTPAKAGIYSGLQEELCMADAYLLKPGNSLPQNALNCTANDVEITNVEPVDPNAECTLGEVFTFQADVTVKTNASERYDTTFYLPLTNQSPQGVQGNNANCSLVLPIPDDEPGQVADVNIDGDQCGDITKANGTDQYVLYDESITMLCTPSADDPTKAEFTYCAAWDNIERNNCTVAADPYPGQIPNTKSKCNCDSFPIDVFIRPPAPTISKTLFGIDTNAEPGGEYTFDLIFTNPSSTTSIFISKLTDEVDDNADGSYETSLDLWGPTTVVDGSTPEGVYLTYTNCPVGSPLYEVGLNATYSCRIKVHIVDSDLPDDQSPELYNDVIKVVLQDKNGDPVTNGQTCPYDLNAVDGEHCSPTRQVKVTNVAPSITVTKTPNVDYVLEPGGDVTFTVELTSTSGNYDDPLTITSINDSIFGDLNGVGTCATGGSLFLGSPYSCTFTTTISGNAGDVHNDTVTVTAKDNENDVAQHSDGATVNINDIPSLIHLEKTANPIQVDETGDDPNVYRDVVYTFVFSVDASGVDNVTFSSLTDDIFGNITNDCLVNNTTPLIGFVLAPGQSASCTFTAHLQGDADEIVTNVATINGTDADGQSVMDSDDATVTFLDTGLDIAKEYAMKATVFVRLTNGSVDIADITAITFKGINLVADAGLPNQFDILNEAASSSYETGDGPYAFCSTGVSIDPGARYDCAFTLKLYPGFEAGNISLLATGVNGLVFTLADDEGNPVSTGVDISIQTTEP